MNLYATLKDNFNLSSNYLRYSIRLTLACFIALIVEESLHLQNGYWVVFSVIACVWPTFGISLQRTKQRIVGTFIGMWLGIIVGHFFGGDLVYIDIILPIFIFLTFYLRAFSYSYYVIFVTVMTVLFICLLVPGDWEIAFVRMEMTIIGATIAYLATRFIFPSHARYLLPQQLALVKASLEEFYLAMIKNFQKPNSPRLQIIQTQTFKKLQAALAVLQEGNFECGYFSEEYKQQLLLYQNLEAFYQKLLLLEIHLPSQIKHECLQFTIQPLQAILAEVGELFSNFDLEKFDVCEKQLAELVHEIRQQRIRYLHDLSVPSAILFDHMQLTIFLEMLQKFLFDLAAVAKLQTKLDKTHDLSEAVAAVD